MKKVKSFGNFEHFEEINNIFGQFLLLIPLFSFFENMISMPLLPASRHF